MTPSNRETNPDPQPWPIDSKAQRAEGERRRDAGMTLAADRKSLRVKAGKIAFLDALLRSTDGTATLDDATPPDDLQQKFSDGGKWRGSVPLSLSKAGIIEKAGEAISNRPSRHAGTLRLWRLVDRPKAILLRCRLSAALDAELSLMTGADLAKKKNEAPTAPFAEEQAAETSADSNPNFLKGFKR